jgi:RHS repeat-associated protein
MLGNTLGVSDNGNFTKVNMTAFGETTATNNSSLSTNHFFTGKPYISELGYAVLFRNYRPEQGKWQTADPLGYPDGWNNLAYVNNGVTGAIDYLGMECVAADTIQRTRNYILSTGPLVVEKLSDFSYLYSMTWSAYGFEHYGSYISCSCGGSCGSCDGLHWVEDNIEGPFVANDPVVGWYLSDEVMTEEELAVKKDDWTKQLSDAIRGPLEAWKADIWKDIEVSCIPKPE